MIKKARRIIGRKPEKVNDNEPELWSEKTRRQKIIEIGGALKYVILAITSFILGPVIYVQSYIPSIQGNEYILLGFVVLGLSILSYIKGREDGINKIRQLDQSIIFTPGENSSVLNRYGRIIENSDGETVFIPIKSLSYGGLSKSYVRLQDEYPKDIVKSHKNKYERGHKNDTLKDRLESFVTFTTSSSEFGVNLSDNVAVTHASKLKDDMSSRKVDRETSPPDEIDRRLATRTQRQLNQQEDELKYLNNKIQSLEQNINKLLNDINEDESQTLNEVISILKELSLVNGNNIGSSSNINNSEGLESKLTGDENE